MPTHQPKVIELTEYQPVYLAQDALPYGVGQTLWQNYGQQVSVNFPDPTTDNQWRLTSQGWVGYIALTPELHLNLQPKVSLSNLFRMLEYAYKLKSFKFLAGRVDCHSLPEFYERLAYLLAQRVLERGRKGFQRAYVSNQEIRPYVRGRLDVRQTINRPEQVNLLCHTQEHTTDIEDNQILAWTLRYIIGRGLCSERVLPTIRQAYRTLQNIVARQPYAAKACQNRSYTRLNADYQPMHALCYFFLAQSGPGHQLGAHPTMPFLVDMARLFELFVAEWLQTHPPSGLQLKQQERVHIGTTGAIYFDIDLVLRDSKTGTIQYVLDTKYKTPDKPATDDIFQIVTYAEAKGCREAILLYPKPLRYPIDETIGQIRVRSLAFDLSGDLEAAGYQMYQTLLAGMQTSQ